MQQQQQAAEAVALVCLQAQQVAGLPDAAEGRHIHIQLLPSTTTDSTPAPTTAVAVCRAGVADFHRQVLLLHCAPVNSIDAVALTVTMAATCSNHDDDTAVGAAPSIGGSGITTVNVDLAEQLRLRRPSPSVLSFVLGVSGASTTTATTAAAVLSLTLHHRLLVTTTRTRTRTGTGCSSSLLRSCLRLPLPLAAGCCPPQVLQLRTTKQQQNRQHQGPEAAADDNGNGDSSSSSGFITIEKGTISRRRPPSDYLLTTDDDDDDDNDEVDGKRRPPPTTTTTTTCGCWSLDLDDDTMTKVEDDFLAMLMLDDGDHDDDLDQLDALIKDAEADLALAAIWPSRG